METATAHTAAASAATAAFLIDDSMYGFEQRLTILQDGSWLTFIR